MITHTTECTSQPILARCDFPRLICKKTTDDWTFALWYLGAGRFAVSGPSGAVFPNEVSREDWLHALDATGWQFGTSELKEVEQL